MKTYTAVVLIVIALILGHISGYLIGNTVIKGNMHKVPDGPIIDNDNDMENSASNTSGMRVEENAIVISGQKPGNTAVISQVFLAAPGYVVIHTSGTDGNPGPIIGSSMLLEAGASDDVKVKLNRNTKNGETYFGMLHAEKNGNAIFNSTTDTPVQSRIGGPIMMMFDISSMAEESGAVSI